MTKPIYDAPVVEQLKDLRRACDMALDFIDTMPLKMITAQDMRRTGLKEGEFALCDWVVRPRFPEPESECSYGPTFPTTFKDWWNYLPVSPKNPDNRCVGMVHRFDSRFEITREQAEAIWQSMGLSIE